MRTKEHSENPAVAMEDHQDDISSSDDDGQAHRHSLLNTSSNAGGDRKKPRIPWDRNPLGDKNGLKLALLNIVNEHSFHVDGGLMENFREVSRLLSQEGSKFEKYDGIEPSGAQRKFNSIIREIANHFPLKDNGEFENEESADGFQVLALKILRDIISKEKAKLGSFGKADNLLGDESHVMDEDGNKVEPASVPATSFLKKRKAEITPLKHQLKRIAGVIANPTPGDSSFVSDKGDDDDDIHDSGINRLDTETHSRVIQELEKLGIRSVGDLLKAADISSTGIHNFVAKTQVKLTKPVDRVLKLYEEVAVAKDFVAKMSSLCGLQAGDALEFESYVKPLYTQTHNSAENA